MSEEKVVGFPGRREADVAFAERFHDVILEGMARGRLSQNALPKGDATVPFGLDRERS